jgi:hypothetical protein
MKSFFSFSIVSSSFTRGDPLPVKAVARREPLPTFPSSSASSVSSPGRSESYSNATLLQSGSVDASVTQYALSPLSAWWLR